MGEINFVNLTMLEGEFNEENHFYEIGNKEDNSPILYFGRSWFV